MPHVNVCLKNIYYVFIFRKEKLSTRIKYNTYSHIKIYFFYLDNINILQKYVLTFFIKIIYKCKSMGYNYLHSQKWYIYQIWISFMLQLGVGRQSLQVGMWRRVNEVTCQKATVGLVGGGKDKVTVGTFNPNIGNPNFSFLLLSSFTGHRL